MKTELSKEHSSDLWDYVKDIAGFPSRKDRDALVAVCGSNERSDSANRIAIWDYFFRPLPEQVGAPIREEARQLVEQKEAEATRLEKESARIGRLIREREQEAISKSERTQSEIAALEAELKRDLSRQYRVAALLLGIGAVLSVPLWSTFVGLELGVDINWNNACAGCISAAAGVLFLWFGGVFVIRALFGDLKKRSVTLKDKLEQLKLSLVQDETEAAQEIQSLSDDSDRLLADFAEKEASISGRLEFLQRLLDEIISQIPEPPRDDTVYGWLLDEIARLRELSLDQFGLRGRNAYLLGASQDQAHIFGPAELQVEDLIPPHYKEPSTDETRHLRALRDASLNDGRNVVIFGTFYVWFFYITEDELSIYRAFYDFITGDRSQEVCATYYYGDIVSMQQLRSYRKVLREGEHPIEVKSAYSLKFSFKDGHELELTFPDREYLKKVGVAKPESIDLGAYTSEGIEDAIRNLQKSVSDRKREE